MSKLSEFFFDTPLYTNFKLESEDMVKSVDLSMTKQTILWGSTIIFDGYNPFKQHESSFVVISSLLGKYETDNKFKQGVVSIKCKRNDHVFDFLVQWHPEKESFIKVGQFPSVADFHINEIKHYKKVLGDDKQREFTKEIGLAANGVGIGSFVYLRRIFEQLIFDTYNLCLEKRLVTKEEYQKTRIDEKIQLLSDHLPTFLVENKEMYSILSLGIHELDEKTCLKYFDTLRVGIEIILDEKLEQTKKEEKIKKAKAKINATHQKVKELKKK